jgi:hypothetical protein
MHVGREDRRIQVPEVDAGFILVHKQNLAALATNLANTREHRELEKRETDRVVA